MTLWSRKIQNTIAGLCLALVSFAAITTISSGTLMAQTAPRAVATRSASDYYSKARNYFAAAQYREAIQYAAAAARRSPEARMPIILMAQSYYRLGNTARAAKLFLQVPLGDLPKEASVDYVLTMFAVGRHRDAIKGYSVVPDSHPYKDVTRFYAGVSLMHLRLYQKAQMYLRGARRIPSNLNSQRRRLLSEIDDILENERQNVFDQPGAYTYQAQQYYVPPPVVAPPDPQGTQRPAAKKPEAPPPPKEGVSYYAKPAIAYNQTSRKRDFHGYKQEQYDEVKPTASATLGLKYLGRPRSFGSQPTLDATFVPSYYDIATKTNTSSLQADVTDPTNVRNVTTSKETSGYNMAQTIGVQGVYPLTEPVDIGAGFDQKNEQAKGSAGKLKQTTETLSLKSIIEFSSLKLDLSQTSASITDKLTPDNSQSIQTTKVNLTRNGENTTAAAGVTAVTYSKPKINGGIKSSSGIDVSWLRNLDDFSLGLSANNTTKTRAGDFVSSSNAQVLDLTSGKIEGTYNMNFGLSVIVSYTQIQYGKIVVRNVVVKDPRVPDGADEVMASGSGNQVKATVKAAPVSFMTLSASWDYTTRKLSVSDAGFEKFMMTDNWSTQTLTTLNVGMSYSF
jgi:tetratricopeptide (TPR) repeat protein